MASSIDLEVRRVHNTPMKVILKGDTLYGCFWYGDNFYPKASFTSPMWDAYRKFHADTFVERMKEDV